MSVPTWKRKISKAEYIYRLYLLNIRLGEIFVNKPKKYKDNYSDAIIKTALSALNHAQIADSIYLSKYTTSYEFEIRERNLILARGEIASVATDSYIFLEIIRKHDYASEQDERLFQKLYDQELEIGKMCEDCYNLISGIIKSDKEVYKKYISAK